MINYDEFIEKNKDNITGLLCELIGFDSVRDTAEQGMPFGKANAECLDAMAKAAEKMGFKVNNADNYYITVDYLPEGCNEIKLGILSHLDVVPAGDGWSKNPFKAEIADGKIYGRGATDDKGPSVSALYALYAVKELGTKLSGGVRLIFGSNEESGSQDIEYYLKNDKMPPMIFTPDAQYPIINCEKGIVGAQFKAYFEGCFIKDIYGGQVRNAVPSTAGCTLQGITLEEVKAAVKENGCEYEITQTKDEDIKVICNGKSAHASTPQLGVNAISGLFDLLSRLTVCCRQKDIVQGILKLYPLGEYNGASLKMDLRDELGELTHVLSMVSIDENGYIVFTTDTRFPVCSSKAQIKELMEKAVSAEGFELCAFDGLEPHYTNPDSHLIKSLSKVYERKTGKKGECIAIGGGTYVHGVEGGVAFGCEHEGIDYNIHGADEYIPITDLLQNTAIFAEAIEEICK